MIAGANYTLSVTSGGFAPVTYQWYKNGTAISGATNTSLPLTNLSFSAHQGTYTVVVTDATNSPLTSNAAVVTVLQIQSQSGTSSALTGQAISYTVTMTTGSGVPPDIYQWYLDSGSGPVADLGRHGRDLLEDALRYGRWRHVHLRHY